MRETSIFADIGNSRIKLASVGGLQWSFAKDTAFQIDLPSTSHDWFVCSVSPTESNRLRRWVERNRPEDQIHMISHNNVPLEIEVDEPLQVGLDRLMAATAAREIIGDGDIVVVDAGTAVTVDAVSGSRFLGGTISPGSQTEFAALRANAEQLPLIDEHCMPQRVIGKSTTQAIQSGVLHGQVGSVLHLVQLIAAELRHPKIIATGGGLVPLKSHIPPDWKIIPDLVLDGIRVVAQCIQEQR